MVSLAELEARWSAFLILPLPKYGKNRSNDTLVPLASRKSTTVALWVVELSFAKAHPAENITRVMKKE